uniref:Uncharacterized protein n=1 Tax=Oryza brachyantha TaxID=4533 RepID=J3L5J4_ORYBR
MASIKANRSSNAALETPSSSKEGAYSGTFVDSSLRVSRSSRMLLCLFVMRRRYSDSIG